MTVIQVRVNHGSSSEIAAEIKQRYGVEELSDGAAVGIASWYQTPGGSGRRFAALASGAPVDHHDLLDAIYRERQHIVHSDSNAHREFDMLATWVIAKVREVEGR